MNRKIFISESADHRIIEVLSRFGEVIKLKNFSHLPSPVSSHADMLLFLHKDTLFIPDGYINENGKLFSGIKVCRVSNPENNYPHDILLDCLALGDCLVCNEKYTSPEVAAHFRTVNVKQGYARCSCLKISDSAIITADKGILRAAERLGCDTLLTVSGHIGLEGYSFGFIGGASCVIDETVIFFGDISAHPDSDRIKKFIHSHGKKIIEIEGMPLYDYGGAVVI